MRPVVMACAWIWVMRFWVLIHLSSKDLRDDKVVFMVISDVVCLLPLECCDLLTIAHAMTSERN